MPRLEPLLTALLLGLALSSCGLLKRDKGPELVKGSENSPDGPTYLVGLIELVNPEQRFVLIRTEGKVVVPAGRELVAIDATGAQSKLKVSPEKKQHFLTADITDGQPRVGNLVAYRPGKAVTPPPTPALPANPDQPSAVSTGPTPPVLPPPAPAAPAEFLTPAGLSSGEPARPSPIPPQPQPTVPAAPSPASGGQLTPTEQQIVLPPVVR